MNKDPRDEMQPQPEDDDETLRRKLRAKWGEEGARRLEGSLQDPAYLEGVRENARRERDKVGRAPSPGKKGHGFNTAQFEFARAIVEGKIQVVRGPNAGASDEINGIVEQVSGEREIDWSGEMDPAVAKAAAALSTKQHATVEELGQLGAAVGGDPIAAPVTDEMSTLKGQAPITEPVTDEMSTLKPTQGIAAPVTDEMSTLKQAPKVEAPVTDEMSTLERQRPKALESDEMSTVPGGRYADDPRQQQQAVVRVEQKGSVATAALGVMKTDAMPAPNVPISAPPESAPPSSAWTAGRKPKLKILTDRVATVDASTAAAFAAAGAAEAAPPSLRRVATEPLPPTAGAATQREDAPEVPVTRSRAWTSVLVVALVLLVIGYVARRPTSESNATPSTSAAMTDALPASPPTVVPIATTAAPVLPTASATAPPSTSATAENTAGAATSVSARPTKPPNASPPHPSAAPKVPPSARPTPSAGRTPDPYEKPNHP